MVVAATAGVAMDGRGVVAAGATTRTAARVDTAAEGAGPTADRVEVVLGHDSTPMGEVEAGVGMAAAVVAEGVGSGLAAVAVGAVEGVMTRAVVAAEEGMAVAAVVMTAAVASGPAVRPWPGEGSKEAGKEGGMWQRWGEGVM